MMKKFTCITLCLIAIPLLGISQTNSTSPGKRIDVTNVGILNNSEADQTTVIQNVIESASAGDTLFFPEGEYLIRSLQLKSGVHILSEGILKHHPNAKIGQFSIEKQNSPNPLIIGRGVKDLSISIRAKSKNEGIYLWKSHQIRIYDSEIVGDSTKSSSHPGIMTFESSGIEIDHVEIRNFGIAREKTNSYHPGSGIRILSSNTISIRNSEIYQNGENGVFIHGSRKVEVINNVIRHNGMSGIQVAFGPSGKERDYIFSDNILDSNAADAIDINNRSEKDPMDIECLISANITCDNGYVGNESTPDGSGIVTLINVSNVIIYKNEAYRNNRPAIYLESCGIILARENKADNQVEITLGLDEFLMVKNSFGSVNLIANTDANSIYILDNKLGSISLPNGIQVNELVIEKNLLSNASLNLNMEGQVRIIDNIIKNKSKNPAILIVKAGEAIIENNEILSLNASAIVLRPTAQNVELINNKIESIETGIFDENSKSLLVRDNTITSLSGGEKNQAFRSHYPRNLTLTGNEYHGISEQVTVLLVGNGQAKVSDEKLVSGTVDYGEVKISKN